MKIDAHVQFDGTAWRTFMSLQPALKCETPDHATCKLASDKIAATLTAEQEAAEAERQTKQAADVEAAAQAQKRNLYQERVDKAGGMKWEATRIAGVRKTVAQNQAIAAAAKKIGDARNACALAERQAQDGLDAAMDKATADHIAACREIEATDWLEKVDEAGAVLAASNARPSDEKPAPADGAGQRTTDSGSAA